jgi:hypothetical protein
MLYSISLLLLSISCRQTIDFPESYTITFKNAYFEILDSVEIGGKKTENIAPGEDKKFENIYPGTYRIIVITHSQLKIEALINLTGSNSGVTIIIKDTGKILLEKHLR